MGLDWEELVGKVMSVDFARSLRVVRVPETGGSGPRVMIVVDPTSGKTYAIKYGHTRVPILTQVGNRAVIAPLFKETHVPEVIAAGEHVLIMPAVGDYTLHEAVIKGAIDQEYIVKMYERILKRFSEVWQQTAIPAAEFKGLLTRDPVARADKISDAVMAHAYASTSLAAAADLPVVVNGDHLGATIRELLGRMRSEYRPPSHYVTCHGDPNADNIVFDGSHRWWLLDWEWVGTHDWRLLASHFIGWWISNATFMLGSPAINIHSDHIAISYEVTLDKMAPTLVEMGWQLAARMGVQFKEDNWRQQVELQLAVLLLGDIRFVEARGRSRHVIPLLGEGLRRLASL